MNRLIIFISILVSCIFFLIIKLEFKYLILYFILLNLTIISIFFFSDNKKLKIKNRYIIIFTGAIIINFLFIVIGFYIGKKIIVAIPLFIILIIKFFITKPIYKDIKVINNNFNLEEYDIYIRKINRRIEKCNDMILEIYRKYIIDDNLTEAFLTEVRLRLRDLEDKKTILNEEVIKSSNFESNSEIIILKIQSLYIDIENIRISLERFKSKTKNEIIINKINNEGYLEIIKLLELKMESILEEVKENNCINKKNFTQIEQGLFTITNNIEKITDKFNDDINRIIYNLNENPNQIIDSLIDFEKNINDNLNRITQKFDFDNKILSIEEKQTDIYKLLNEKNDEQKEFIKIEREKYVKILAEKINELDLGECENILKYKNKFSKEGFNYLNNAEVLFKIINRNKKILNDFSPLYINYTKFLEYEISNKINLNTTNTSFGVLIKKLSCNKKWNVFLDELEKTQIRKKRNLAAHGGSEKITIKDIDEIRSFIFNKNIVRSLTSNN